MADEKSYDNEVFIDADSGFTNEKNSYENLILLQMQKCTNVLSREMTGGQIIHKEGVGGVEKYIEDVRELVINHIDTLRMLMCTYIKDENKKSLNAIMKEIEDYKKEIGEIEINIPGRGPTKMKLIKGVHVDNPIWKEFISFKALKYRDIFEVLVNSYNEQRAYLRSLEEE
jgi:hypothetical protein